MWIASATCSRSRRKMPKKKVYPTRKTTHRQVEFPLYFMFWAGHCRMRGKCQLGAVCSHNCITVTCKQPHNSPLLFNSLMLLAAHNLAKLCAKMKSGSWNVVFKKVLSPSANPFIRLNFPADSFLGQTVHRLTYRLEPRIFFSSPSSLFLSYQKMPSSIKELLYQGKAGLYFYHANSKHPLWKAFPVHFLKGHTQSGSSRYALLWPGLSF